VEVRVRGAGTTIVRLAAACGAGLCLLTACAGDPQPDPLVDTGPPMTLTVSAVTDAPVTVWFDSRQRTPSGLVGDGVDSTPVELTPQRPAAVVSVPYRSGNWLLARVSGPPDRPVTTVVGCELRSATGRVVAADAADPFGPPPGEAACAGAG
jgi:hypothetical protein